MAQVPEVLLPEPGERGLASVDAEALVTAVGRAWDLFGDLVDDVDLDAVARGRGLLAREVVIPLGAWPDNRPIAVLVDEARRGVVGDAVHRDAAVPPARRDAAPLGVHLRSGLSADALRPRGQAPARRGAGVALPPMPTPRNIRTRWQRRLASVLSVLKRPGFWARVLPLAALYGLTKHLPTLATYVKEGGGLIMVGGPESFGPGMYAGSPLAGVLPVTLTRDHEENGVDLSSFTPVLRQVIM